jgi:RNA polymerase sigma-70 factor (ECF subfamily)
MTFEEIYGTYSPKVYRLCMGYVNDHDGAKDLVQEIFIIVWQNLPKFRNESSVSTWVYRIATNTCLRHVEKSKRMPKAELPAQMAEVKEAPHDEQIDYLYKCISELPETEKIIISLELEDVPQAEIASVVGLSEGNVRVKLHRIKEKLTAKFSKHEQFQ